MTVYSIKRQKHGGDTKFIRCPRKRSRDCGEENVKRLLKQWRTVEKSAETACVVRSHK